jgi:hypothetical protein
MEVVYKEDGYRIMGACFAVYKEMGCGFLEAVYQECLEIEFLAQDIPFKPRAALARTADWMLLHLQREDRPRPPQGVARLFLGTACYDKHAHSGSPHFVSCPLLLIPQMRTERCAQRVSGE